MKIFFSEKKISILLLCLLAALIVVISILAGVPPVSRDALMDLLYMVSLYFGNDIIPKFIHFVFALLTGWLIYSYLRKRLDTGWALLGVLFFLSLPIIVKLSITVYVDLGLVFFSTASLMSIFKWIERRFEFKFLLLSAVCCGLALGTKYNGLLVLFILTVFIPLVFVSKFKHFSNLKKTEGKGDAIKVQLKAIGLGAAYCIIALLVFSPWMIRNYSWKQNPIYPLYNEVFNPPHNLPAETLDGNTDAADPGNRPQISRNSSRWGPFALRKVIYSESWWQIALIPVRIFFQGQDDKPKYFDGRLNPFLFLLPLFAFFHLKSDSPAIRTEKKILGFFTIFFILYAFLQTDMRIRYIAPTIPPLVILAVHGLNNLTALAADRWARAPGWFVPGCTVLLATLMLSVNTAYIIKQFDYVDPFSYMGGKISRNEYIARYRPEYRAFQYANRNLPDDVKVLALFLGNRSYYSDRELFFGDNLFKKIVKKSNSSDMIGAEIQRLGITHLLIVQFNEKEKKRLGTFLDRNLNRLFSQSGYGLFGLKPRT